MRVNGCFCLLLLILTSMPSLIVCDFQKDMCGFIQDTSDNFNWTRNKGSTPTSGTGPILDHTLGSRLGIV